MEQKLAIRNVFWRYGLYSLIIGLGIMAILGLLWVFRWLIDWKVLLEPADGFTFAAGLLLILIPLGPYLATVNQLKGVARIKATLNRPAPVSLRRRQITLAILIAVGIIFAGLLIGSRSLVLWLAFGGLTILMGVALLFIARRIAQIEKAANITIYQTDYNWHFDKTSFIGVIKTGPPSKLSVKK